MMFYKQRVFLISLVFMIMTTSIASGGELIPFALPWDDQSESITNVSHLLEKPAGKHGFIHIDENGHFVDGAGERIRLLGVNLSFEGNFPTHEQAEKIAARMAKFGINAVRHHHMDTLRAPRGIWKEGTSDKQTLDPENLDRLDYLIYQLKQNGIYSNINLKVGREVINGDGLTHTDQLPRYDKGVDHYHPRLIELQKDYARDLLTHLNPYTQTRYVDEPTVAIVEINNESGLVNRWSGGDLDDLPEHYISPLQDDWNEYLTANYESTAQIKNVWQPEIVGSGEDLLTRSLRYWTFQQVDEGKGSRQIVDEGPNGEEAMKIETTQTGQESWHVQTFYTGLDLKKGGFYKFSVWLKSDRTRDVSVGIKMNHSPWQGLDSSRTIQVVPRWQKFEFTFSPNQDEPNARLDIGDLGDEIATLWISQPKLIESNPVILPEGETLEQGNISILKRENFAARTMSTRQDWMDFLVQRETEYYRDMNQFLKNELGVKQVIAGTQLGFGTLPAQMENDYIDIHSYWQHPVFPNRSWDSVDWFVRNSSIVNELDNPLQRLMTSHVEGKAITVSEYNHPAPNTYASEVIPLLAAYGAYQDWDGIFYYSYSHTNNYASRSINSFFDIYGHTPKMIAMPIAAMMFHRGDVTPAQEHVVVPVERDHYVEELTSRNGSTWYEPFGESGLHYTAPYYYQTLLRYGNEPQSVDNPPIPQDTAVLESDTGELVWNQRIGNKGYVAIRSENTKGFVGFIARRTFDLGHGFELQIGDTIQDWANVLLSKMKEYDKGFSWLLTASGYAENKGMVWKDDEKTSVGNQWGSGPPMVETIPLSLTITPQLIQKKMNITVYPLDERGQRQEALTNAFRLEDNTMVVDLMDQSPSVWYELEFQTSAMNGWEVY